MPMQLVKTNWVNGVTSETTTDSIEVPGATQFSLQVKATGSGHAGCNIDRSNDGVNWFGMFGVNTASDGNGAILSYVLTAPVKYVRLRVAFVDGSTSVSASAVIS